MFTQLQDGISQAFKKLRGHGTLTEENISEALEDVKKALLDADVGFDVAKGFIEKVKARAIGREVMKSLTPTQQVLRIVNDELAALMGRQAEPLKLATKPPVVVMLVGLQGSGKTTTAAKLALVLRKKFKRSPYLVPADIYRPAAIDQLKKLASDNKLDYFDTQPGQDPVYIAERARENARKFGYDTVIIDTAGRLSIDEDMMNELSRIESATHPTEILLVLDGMTGQDAVETAKNFHEKLKLTGVVLTKLDGDARGGAALSVRQVTNLPIKFIGVGEKADQLEVFHPDRMASRILDLGDVMSLVEKTAEAVNIEKAEQMRQKLARDEFTLDDFREQLQQLKKMGSLEDTLKMIPGMGKALKNAKNMRPPDEDIKKVEAIINSMTKKERADVNLLNGSRRRRIATGSGTSVQDVNRFIKQYEETRKLMKQFTKTGAKGLMRGLASRGIMR
jgi:signal recognition particle subunit SRP54